MVQKVMDLCTLKMKRRQKWQLKKWTECCWTAKKCKHLSGLVSFCQSNMAWYGTEVNCKLVHSIAWLSVLMPSTPGVCGKSFGSHTPDTLQMSLFGTLQVACQSLKGSSPSGWGSSGTCPGWIPRKTTIVSSLPHYIHHLTGGDPPGVQEPLGWERLGRTYSHRISGSTRHGGRQRREILGTRSSVRQRSARSSPPRRRLQ